MVSTDDPAIARVAEEAGAAVPFTRPPELSGDTAPEWLAWQHAIRYLDSTGSTPDLMVVLPATAPLRAVEDVEATIEAASAPDVDLALTVFESARSPYFNMVTMDERGRVSRLLGGGPAPFRRQDAPPVFEITPVAYVARPAYVRAAGSMFEGRIVGVPVPVERAVDIDSQLDLNWAEHLLCQ